MDECSILECMRDHHKRLEDMLSSPAIHVKEHYERFRWELEKHVFIEERAIFIHYTPLTQADNDAMVKVTKEHTEILALLRSMDEIFAETGEISIEALKDKLHAHQQLEEEVLYPRLDSELEPGAKAMVIRRIKEII